MRSLICFFFTVLVCLQQQAQCDSSYYDLQDWMVGYYRFDSDYPTLNSVTSAFNNLYAYSVFMGCSGNTQTDMADNSYGSYFLHCVKASLYLDQSLSAVNSMTLCMWFRSIAQELPISIFTLTWDLHDIHIYDYGTHLLFEENYLGGTYDYNTFQVNYNSSQWNHLCIIFWDNKVRYDFYLNAIRIDAWNAYYQWQQSSSFHLIISNLMWVDELRFFNMRLLPFMIEGVYQYKDNNKKSLLLPCPTTFRCSDFDIIQPCTRCPENYYISSSPSSEYCLAHPSEVIVRCSPCHTLTDVSAGLYLNFICAGNTTEKNEILLCDTAPCLQGYYRHPCNGTQNSVCNVPYTTCIEDVQYLAEAGEYNDGYCENCTVCAYAYYLRKCSMYQDSICASECNATIQCDLDNSICIYKEPQNTSIYSHNMSCYVCPNGFKADPVINTCLPCKHGHICSSLGDVLCDGECDVGYVPLCSIYSLQATCKPQLCDVVNPPSNASFIRNTVNNLCDSVISCDAGYYLKAVYDNDDGVRCSPCTLLAANDIPVTHGLFFDDPVSCVFRKFDTRIDSIVSDNKKGFYNMLTIQSLNGINRLVTSIFRCPAGHTSFPLKARYYWHCFPCPSYPNLQTIIITSDNTCDWVCNENLNYFQYGSTCIHINEVFACTQPGQYISATESCEFHPLPWQQSGKSFSTYPEQFTKQTVFGPLNLSQRFVTISEWGVQSVVTPTFRFVIFPRPSILYMDNWYNTSATPKNISVPGPICSLAYDEINHETYVVFCQTGMVFYLNSQEKLVKVIGQNKLGYLEGMRDEALFQDELHILCHKARHLLVLDTWNCVLREIVLGPDGPGDSRTKSYRLYAELSADKPICDMLWQPRFLIPLLQYNYPSIVAFVNRKSQVCQYHILLYKLYCLPLEIVTVQDRLIGIHATTNGLQLILEYKDFYDVVEDPGTPCPDDYTSISGGLCSLYYPWNNGEGSYISPENGTAYPCLHQICDPGWFFTPCSRSSPGFCSQCSVSSEYNIKFLYSNKCDYVFAQPCAKNWYAEPATGECFQCPHVMYTVEANMNGSASCLCPEPLIQVQGADNIPDCVVPSNSALFTLPYVDVCDNPNQFTPWNSYGTCALCGTSVWPVVPLTNQRYSTIGPSYVFPCADIFENAFSLAFDITFPHDACGWDCDNGFEALKVDGIWRCSPI